MTSRVIRAETRTVRTVVSVGPVDGDPLGTFGWFIGVRCRHRNSADRAKDRQRFGTCIICRRPFADDDPIHMVLNVDRNGKRVGNRLCCTDCATTHATYHRLTRNPAPGATS